MASCPALPCPAGVHDAAIFTDWRWYANNIYRPSILSHVSILSPSTT